MLNVQTVMVLQHKPNQLNCMPLRKLENSQLIRTAEKRKKIGTNTMEYIDWIEFVFFRGMQ